MSYQNNLMTDKRFWPAFWTQFWGAFNDNVFKNSMVILIAYKSFTIMGLSSEQMVALCGGIFILPFFLFSALAGQISDKYSKNKLMYYIKIWEIIVMIIGAMGFYFENIIVLLSSLFFMGLQSTFFGPVKYSILPELINEDELIHGNALIEMGTFMSILLGTILGGTLIAIEGMGKIYVAITVILLAIIGTFFSSKLNKLEPGDKDLKINIGLIKPNLEILKITKEIKSVFLSILGISWFWFVGAALLSVFPVYVKNELHGTESMVTLFLAVFSIGVAVGSVICEKLSREHLELGLVPIGSIGMTLFLLDLYWVGNPAYTLTNPTIAIIDFVKTFDGIRILFDLFMFSVLSGFFIVPLYTFIQQRSEESKRSRVIAGNNILNALFMVAASIMLAVLFQYKVTVVETFAIIAVLNIIVAAYIYTVLPEFLWRFVCVVLSRIIYRFDIKGNQNIPHDSAAVIVCNHVSFIDWLIVAASVKRPVRFVMHYSFMKNPVLRFFFRGAKVIPIAGKNEDEKILESSFDKISEELNAGEIICIFPEGKITNDGKLNPYKAGIEKIIERNPVPVIPMTLEGLWGSFFSRKYGKAASKPAVILKTIRSKIKIGIYEPIPSKDVTAKELEIITKRALGEDLDEDELPGAVLGNA